MLFFFQCSNRKETRLSKNYLHKLIRKSVTERNKEPLFFPVRYKMIGRLGSNPVISQKSINGQQPVAKECFCKVCKLNWWFVTAYSSIGEMRGKNDIERTTFQLHPAHSWSIPWEPCPPWREQRLLVLSAGPPSPPRTHNQTDFLKFKGTVSTDLKKHSFICIGDIYCIMYIPLAAL